MRTIAGQINDFDFDSVSEGVNDPVLGDDVRAIFERDWKAQITAAVQLLASPDVEVRNLVGDEHLGATFGTAAPLPDLAVDLPLPPGARLGFAFAIDAVVRRVNTRWGILTSQNSRLDTSGNPSS